MKWGFADHIVKSIGGIHMDNQSISHTTWNCTYHVAFIPKYRRKIMYGEVKVEVGEILRKLCEMKQINLIEGKVCVDHVHMYLAVPPKLSISDVMAYLKGKSSLMIFDRHPEYRPKWGDRHFWARGITLRLSAMSTKRQFGNIFAIRERKTGWKGNDLRIASKGG